MLRRLVIATPLRRLQQSKVQHIQHRQLTNLSIGVPKEQQEGEGRVALIPANVAKLLKAGTSAVTIQSGAGSIAGYTDAQYSAAGAKIDSSPNAEEVWSSKLVAKVLPPTPEEAARVGDRAICGIMQARVNTSLIDQLVKQKATVLAMDSLLRTVNTHIPLSCL